MSCVQDILPDRRPDVRDARRHTSAGCCDQHLALSTTTSSKFKSKSSASEYLTFESKSTEEDSRVQVSLGPGLESLNFCVYKLFIFGLWLINSPVPDGRHTSAVDGRRTSHQQHAPLGISGLGLGLELH